MEGFDMFPSDDELPDPSLPETQEPEVISLSPTEEEVNEPSYFADAQTSTTVKGVRDDFVPESDSSSASEDLFSPVKFPKSSGDPRLSARRERADSKPLLLSHNLITTTSSQAGEKAGAPHDEDSSDDSQNMLAGTPYRATQAASATEIVESSTLRREFSNYFQSRHKCPMQRPKKENILSSEGESSDSDSVLSQRHTFQRKKTTTRKSAYTSGSCATKCDRDFKSQKPTHSQRPQRAPSKSQSQSQTEVSRSHDSLPFEAMKDNIPGSSTCSPMTCINQTHLSYTQQDQNPDEHAKTTPTISEGKLTSSPMNTPRAGEDVHSGHQGLFDQEEISPIFSKKVLKKTQHDSPPYQSLERSPMFSQSVNTQSSSINEDLKIAMVVLNKDLEGDSGSDNTATAAAKDARECVVIGEQPCRDKSSNEKTTGQNEHGPAPDLTVKVSVGSTDQNNCVIKTETEDSAVADGGSGDADAKYAVTDDNCLYVFDSEDEEIFLSQMVHHGSLESEELASSQCFDLEEESGWYEDDDLLGSIDISEKEQNVVDIDAGASGEDPYGMPTQVDEGGIIELYDYDDGGGDRGCCGSPVNEGDDNGGDSDFFMLETQVEEPKSIGSHINNRANANKNVGVEGSGAASAFDPFILSTQVATDEDGSDPYSQQTLADEHENVHEVTPDNDGNEDSKGKCRANPYNQQTVADEVADPYDQATQIMVSEMSDEDDAYLQQTQIMDEGSDTGEDPYLQETQIIGTDSDSNTDAQHNFVGKTVDNLHQRKHVKSHVHTQGHAINHLSLTSDNESFGKGRPSQRNAIGEKNVLIISDGDKSYDGDDSDVEDYYDDAYNQDAPVIFTAARSNVLNDEKDEDGDGDADDFNKPTQVASCTGSYYGLVQEKNKLYCPEANEISSAHTSCVNDAYNLPTQVVLSNASDEVSDVEMHVQYGEKPGAHQIDSGNSVQDDDIYNQQTQIIDANCFSDDDYDDDDISKQSGEAREKLNEACGPHSLRNENDTDDVYNQRTPVIDIESSLEESSSDQHVEVSKKSDVAYNEENCDNNEEAYNQPTQIITIEVDSDDVCEKHVQQGEQQEKSSDRPALHDDDGNNEDDPYNQPTQVISADDEWDSNSDVYDQPTQVDSVPGVSLHSTKQFSHLGGKRQCSSLKEKPERHINLKLQHKEKLSPQSTKKPTFSTFSQIFCRESPRGNTSEDVDDVDLIGEEVDDSNIDRANADDNLVSRQVDTDLSKIATELGESEGNLSPSILMEEMFSQPASGPSEKTNEGETLKSDKEIWSNDGKKDNLKLSLQESSKPKKKQSSKTERNESLESKQKEFSKYDGKKHTKTDKRESLKKDKKESAKPSKVESSKSSKTESSKSSDRKPSKSRKVEASSSKDKKEFSKNDQLRPSQSKYFNKSTGRREESANNNHTMREKRSMSSKHNHDRKIKKQNTNIEKQKIVDHTLKDSVKHKVSGSDIVRFDVESWSVIAPGKDRLVSASPKQNVPLSEERKALYISKRKRINAEALKEAQPKEKRRRKSTGTDNLFDLRVKEAKSAMVKRVNGATVANVSTANIGQTATASKAESSSLNNEDVTMPCTQDMMALGLPILTANLPVDKDRLARGLPSQGLHTTENKHSKTAQDGQTLDKDRLISDLSSQRLQTTESANGNSGPVSQPENTASDRVRHAWSIPALPPTKKRHHNGDTAKPVESSRNNIFSVLQTSTLQTNATVKEPSVKKSSKRSSTSQTSSAKSQPSSGKNEPSFSKSQPSSAKSRPASSKNEPSSAKSQPSSGKNEPSSSKSQPSSGKNEPSAAKSRPASSKNEPSSAKSQPSSGKNEPSSSKGQPSSGKNEPSSTKSRPASSKNEPSSAKSQPSSGKNEPSSAKSQPSSGKNEPSSAKSRPSSSKNEPSSAKSRPSSTIQPSSAKSEPSSGTILPSSANNQSSSCTNQPSSSKSQPSPSTIQPSFANSKPSSTESQSLSVMTEPAVSRIQLPSSKPQTLSINNQATSSSDTMSLTRAGNTLLPSPPFQDPNPDQVKFSQATSNNRETKLSALPHSVSQHGPGNPLRPPGQHTLAPSSTAIHTSVPRGAMKSSLKTSADLVAREGKGKDPQSNPGRRIVFNEAQNRVWLLDPPAAPVAETLGPNPWPPRPQPKRQVRMGQTFKMDMIHTLLGWNPQWLVQQGNSTVPPPVLGQGHSDWARLEGLRLFYTSYQEYATITSRLLKLELWEGILKEWRAQEKHGSFKREDKIIHMKHKPSENEIVSGELSKISTFHMEGHSYEPRASLYPGDILVMRIDNDKAKSGTSKMEKAQFAYVRAVQRKDPQRLSEDIKKLCGKTPMVAFDVTIETKRRLVSSLKGSLVAAKLYSVVSEERQMDVLDSLRGSQFLQHLVADPALARDIFQHQYHTDQTHPTLNSEQAAAVSAIKAAVLGEGSAEKVFLLQGPPGTGKSHTIMALVYDIIRESGFTKRICLATPSNAAVDELAQRIINFSQKLERNNKRPIKMVRVGNKDSVDINVQPFFIKNLAERQAFKVAEKHAPESVKMEMKIFKEKILELEKSISTSGAAQRASHEAELSRLRKKMMNLQLKPTGWDFEQAERQVLHESHVVCGTLSSLGQPRLRRYLAQSGAVPSGRTFRQSFDCIIVDEATQAKEVECLITLQYRTTKLVLVGDQEQLQPTVISQKAQEKELGRSLFARLHLCLSRPAGRGERHEGGRDGDGKDKKGDDDRADSRNPKICSAQSPILTLRRQYRMSDAILQFPNMAFYGGKLYTDKAVQEKRGKNLYRLAPYLVFDIRDSEERCSNAGDTTSTSNPVEAECVGTLCELVSEAIRGAAARQNRVACQERIGVICPYTEQKREIERQLQRRDLRKIAVETVDAFQGQEKDVIIVSCVRAQSKPSTIGFLAERERMNVSLTRAKQALYILGNFNTLNINALWKALHSDAQTRDLLVPIPRARDFPKVAKETVNIKRHG